MFGRQDYRSRDEARNNWLVALLVFGEGWHNNHHAFPASARHGLDRGQIDLSWWVIRGLERLGLVWNVKVPDADAARAAATSERRELEPRRSRAHAAGARQRRAGVPEARAARSRAARPGSARSCPSTPSARARSKPATRLRGRDARDARAASGRASRGARRAAARAAASSESRSGSHGARPTTRSTDGSSAAAIATAPPIEKPSSSVRCRADRLDRPHARPRCTSRDAATT